MKSRPSKIILRVPNWLGDSFMATAAVARLRELNPQARMTLLVRPAFQDFWKAFPGVDSVFTMDAKARHAGLAGFARAARELAAEKFDFALTLPLSFSSAFLFFAARIPIRMGYASEGRSPFLTTAFLQTRARQSHLAGEYVRLVEKACGSAAGREPLVLSAPPKAGTREVLNLVKRHHLPRAGWIALGPGATYGPAKRWPLPYWKQVMESLLASRSESLLILGGREEKEYLKPLAESFSRGPGAKRVRLLAGETTVTGLAALLSRCELLITNDTGPMHAAAAAGTPTVAIFGSTSPTWTRPFGLGHEVIYGKTECSPCFQKTCPIGYVCLNRVAVKDVLQAAEKILIRKIRVRPEPRNTGGLS